MAVILHTLDNYDVVQTLVCTNANVLDFVQADNRDLFVAHLNVRKELEEKFRRLADIYTFTQ